MRHKIYVASSWRNEYYPEVVEKLREAGHDVTKRGNQTAIPEPVKLSDLMKNVMK